MQHPGICRTGVTKLPAVRQRELASQQLAKNGNRAALFECQTTDMWRPHGPGPRQGSYGRGSKDKVAEVRV